MAEEEKKEKPCTTTEKIILCAMFLFIAVVVGFGVYAFVIGVITPETTQSITIKNTYHYGDSSWTYIEDTDCRMYGTTRPSVAMRTQKGDLRTYKIKFYDRFFLPWEPAENKFPEIVEDVTNCK